VLWDQTRISMRVDNATPSVCAVSDFSFHLLPAGAVVDTEMFFTYQLPLIFYIENFNTKRNSNIHCIHPNH